MLQPISESPWVLGVVLGTKGSEKWPQSSQPRWRPAGYPVAQPSGSGRQLEGCEVQAAGPITMATTAERGCALGPTWMWLWLQLWLAGSLGLGAGERKQIRNMYSHSPQTLHSRSSGEKKVQQGDMGDKTEDGQAAQETRPSRALRGLDVPWEPTWCPCSVTPQPSHPILTREAEGRDYGPILQMQKLKVGSARASRQHT